MLRWRRLSCPDVELADDAHAFQRAHRCFEKTGPSLLTLASAQEVVSTGHLRALSLNAQEVVLCDGVQSHSDVQ
jgi:hypothetical protein